MCRKSAQVIGLKKGWFFTSDAPARDPNRLASSLINSFRINDLQRLEEDQHDLKCLEWSQLTSILVWHQHGLGMGLHLARCWRMSRSGSYP